MFSPKILFLYACVGVVVAVSCVSADKLPEPGLPSLAAQIEHNERAIKQLEQELEAGGPNPHVEEQLKELREATQHVIEVYNDIADQQNEPHWSDK